MKIIVGLGNPGRRYAGTRHNAGFMVVDRLAGKLGIKLSRSIRFSAQMGEAEGRGLLLFKPMTFMNNSGVPVGRLARRKGAEACDLVVVLDDADLPVGRLKVSARGSSGGHRGLQSVIDAVGSGEFARIRVGIGRDDDDGLVDHVLSPFLPSESKLIELVMDVAADAVECVADSGVDTAMNRFNGKTVGV